MYETKDEITQELKRQRELLRKWRDNLHKLELQEANHAGEPPIQLMNQLDRVAERVQATEEEIARLQSLAAEDQLSVVEAEFRTLLAETWSTSLGRPTVAGATRLELTRLQLGLAPERAKELELEIRARLSHEILEILDVGPILGLNNRLETSATGTINVVFNPEGESSVMIQDMNISQQMLIDSPFESALKRLGCAIRLDPETALNLLIQVLPPTPPLDMALFAPQLLSVNKVAVYPQEMEIFQQFLTNLDQMLSSRSLPATTE